MRLVLLFLLALCTQAHATIYPCDLVPTPKLCFGMQKLRVAYAGSAITVQKQSTTTSTTIGFSGSNLDSTALYTFLSGEPYGRVIQWNDQSGNGINATCPLVASACSPAGPNIQATSGRGVAIGGTPALSFQGGSNSGAIYGLGMTGLSGLGLSAKDYTVIIVARPTSSAFRNQARTPDLANGTYLSLEAAAPISITGNTSAGSPTITSVSSTAGISAGMVVQSSSTGPLVDPVLISSVNSGASTITLFGANATTTTTGEALIASSPLLQVYANGQNNPGSISIVDNSITGVGGGSFSFAPTDTAIEIDPVVIAVTSDSTGIKVYENEVVRSTASRSALTTAITRGYIGQTGGSIAGGYSRSGDFWTVAMLIYDVALTQAQRAAVSAALYTRFSINQARSRSSVMQVAAVGDSIGSGYIAGSDGHAPDPTLGGLNSYLNLLGNAMPTVRFLNYSVPGIQATSSVGTPTYAYIQGMMPTIVSPSLSYSKIKNILLIFSAGGNDMVSQTSTTAVTFDVPSSRVQWTSHGLSVGARVLFPNNGNTLPTPLAFYPGVYTAVYWVQSVPNANEFTLALTPSGSAITFGGSPTGSALATGLPKTAASIYAGIQSIVSQGLAAGVAKVYVCTLPPRVGGEYIYILDDLNTLILAGAGGSPLYTAIDVGSAAALNPNPNPPNTFTPGTAYYDAGHMNDIGQQAVYSVIYPVLLGDVP